MSSHLSDHSEESKRHLEKAFTTFGGIKGSFLIRVERQLAEGGGIQQPEKVRAVGPNGRGMVVYGVDDWKERRAAWKVVLAVLQPASAEYGN